MHPRPNARESLQPIRCLLGLPASVERFIVKAAQSEADGVMLDLEDSVAPGEKASARRTVAKVLRELDWGAKWITVRINGLDTAHAYRDLVDLGEQCPRLDAFMIPKVEGPADLQAVDTLLRGIELAVQRERPFALDALIESAQGVTRIEAIAESTARLQSLSFGPGDYAASIGSRVPLVGGPDPDYAVLTSADEHGHRARHWNDVWHYPMARIATTCHAFGLRPLDGPYPDVGDPEGFLASARRARALGFCGKWALHPSQVALAHDIFTPSQQEVDFARKVVEALARAYAQGAGEVLLEGKLVNQAHLRMALRILRMAGDEQGGES
ncbi:MAG: CoA ester lyase [Candidatus Lambdaproteobacteria bacterium]|nr:CoA ester lyase [Candidatus Lambdaproteobacteria bacterium]